MISNLSSKYLDRLKRYILTHGWKRTHFDDEMQELYEGPLDDAGEPLQICLSKTSEPVDTEELMETALRLLTVVEDCSLVDMIQRVLNSGLDALFYRLVLPSNAYTVPLSYSKQLTMYLSTMIHRSGETEMQKEPDLGQEKSWKRIEDRCQFGQTFIGSFGISLLMPIEMQPGTQQPPLERRVMERIARACLTVQSAVQTGDERLLTPANGFDLGMCAVMQQLAKMLKGSQMEFSFSWSPECKVSSDLEKIKPILLSADEMQPVLKKALKTARQPVQTEEISVSGHITQLNHAEESATIVMDTHVGPVRMSLTLSEYRLACDAHRDGKRISVRGNLKGKHLMNHADFRVL